MKSFLGVGWTFPPTFIKLGDQSGEAVLAVGDEDIRKSLMVILSTLPGERVMHPKFGCNLQQAVFGAVDSNFKTYIIDIVKTAILLDEPRILVQDVGLEFDDTSSLAQITVDYIVKLTNSPANFVYPYYQQERA